MEVIVLNLFINIENNDGGKQFYISSSTLKAMIRDKSSMFPNQYEK